VEKEVKLMNVIVLDYRTSNVIIHTGLPDDQRKIEDFLADKYHCEIEWMGLTGSITVEGD
jgi:hypothetical protein